MKKVYGIGLATVLAATGIGLTVAPAQAAAAPAGYVQERQWDAPPPELNEAGRRGHHDGIEGARKDFENHRRADVNNRDEFRHPPVPDRDKETYRASFQHAYEMAWAHFTHPHP